jgi:hypothetical protein
MRLVKTTLDSFAPQVTLNSFEAGADFKKETLVLTAIVCAFMLSSLVSELLEAFGIKNMSCAREGQVCDALWEYCTDFWNCLDLARILLFTMSLMTVLAQKNIIRGITSCMVPTHSTSKQAECLDAKFEELITLGESFQLVSAVNVMIHIVWILKYMRHKRLAVVRDTIYTSGDDLSHFMIVFFIVYAVSSPRPSPDDACLRRHLSHPFLRALYSWQHSSSGRPWRTIIQLADRHRPASRFC